MQLQEAFIKLRNDLIALYGDRESTLISHWVIESITGFTRSARLIHNSDSLTAEQESDFHKFQHELLQWRPVQYVLGEAWFSGMKFYVDERVLIPRPETEELVEAVDSRQLTVDSQQHDRRSNSEGGPIRILDVGTGSGCIAIALKKKKQEWDIWAVDLSTDALEVAKQNATSLAVDINFVQIDILSEKSRSALPVFDMIISNPPYIPQKDKAEMRENVLQHEPHLALFVSNDDPLIFYKEILSFANTHLKPSGSLFFEIHEQLAEQVVSVLFASNYLQIMLKQDMQGRDRIISAIKSS
jgi:release factor glutamine methyltransferase